MARRTVNLPDSVEKLVRSSREEGESFSAALSRLIEEGARVAGRRKPPAYVGIGTGPGDLATRAEEYLADLIRVP